jgi:hypothetical protein
MVKAFADILHRDFTSMNEAVAAVAAVTSMAIGLR